MRKKRYYFAYGSNLHLEQMRRRCPGCRAVGACRLPGFELVFRRVADIVPSLGGSVPGAIYSISRTDEMALDRYEGFRAADPLLGMYRKEHFPAEIAGETVEVMYYTMNGGDIQPPSEFYLGIIREGYRNWGLPNNKLNAAVRASREHRGSYLA